MKLENAEKRLKKAGYSVEAEKGQLIATQNGVVLTCYYNSDGICSKFTYDSEGSCAPTYGLSLKSAMS